MGIRVAISYSYADSYVVSGPYTHYLKTFEHAGADRENTFPIIDSRTIELRKLLKHLGGNVNVDSEARFVKFQDNYINFPTIFHSNDNLDNSLSMTHEALDKIISYWNKKNMDAVVAFSIGFRVSERQVIISVLGHVRDIEKWLNNPLSKIPTSRDDLNSWSEKIANYLDSSFRSANDHPSLKETLMESGLLSIQRKPLVNLAYEFYTEQNGLMIKIALPEASSDLRELIEKGEILPSVGSLIMKSTCSKCGSSYPLCDCSYLLHSGVTHCIQEAIPLVPFWTDRTTMR